MKQIINSRIVTSDGIVDGRVLVFSDRIEGIEERPREGVETIDARGKYVIAGLIDLHVHGAYGHEANNGTDNALTAIAKNALRTGVTAFLPTTSTVSFETLEKAFDCTRGLQKRQKADSEYAKSTATILGIHAEGPFLNLKKIGAQNPEHVKPIDFDFVKKNSDVIKLITVAPELDTDYASIKRIVSETDIIVSAGHTSADYETMLLAIEAGVTHATHLFNAMPALSHREPGGAAALLFSDKVSCELIPDTFHVNPAWYKPLHTLKGRKLNLITDAVMACGLPDGTYDLGGLPIELKGIACRLADGSQTIAGSVLTLNKGVCNFHKYSGLPLHEAVNCASLYPAQTLGIDGERGQIKAGLVADLVICNEELDIISVIKNGEMAEI